MIIPKLCAMMHSCRTCSVPPVLYGNTVKFTIEPHLHVFVFLLLDKREQETKTDLISVYYLLANTHY